jgi:hypothetical protein
VLIVDTGVLVAATDRTDPYHSACADPLPGAERRPRLGKQAPNISVEPVHFCSLGVGDGDVHHFGDALGVASGHRRTPASTPMNRRTRASARCRGECVAPRYP